ncbi:MAG: hypothetical protein IAE82_18350 [Opitutaceae bacterium]|nr:hypothetical protein [Opitutaceae bacterium]
MKLAPEQTQAVKSWIAAGASIADVQKRLLDEFKLTLTYRDTRFLIDDLGLDIQAPAPKPATPPPAPAAIPPTGGGASRQPGPGAAQDAELMDEDETFDDTAEDFPAGEAAPAGPSSVKVEVDRVMRPGTVVSGSVTFSDGQSGKWALDQYGRLMFEGSTPGYRPGQGDLQAFQRELSAVLQRQGY